MTDGTPYESHDSAQGASPPDALMDDILKLIDARIANQDGPSRTGRIHVTNQGQISDMVLPKGWKVGVQSQNVQGNSDYRDFRPEGDSDSNARLCFFYRGRVTSRASGERFHTLLKAPDHVLSGKELESLKEVLRDKVTPGFSLLSARTEELNGKRVLMIEGRFVEIQQDVRAILVDANGTTGRVVQEIYYQAPKDSYLRYLKHAKESMNSIEWK